MALIVGKEESAEEFSEWAAEIRNTFNDRFFNESTKTYSTGSQTAMSMPLVLGLVEERYRDQVFSNLTDSIKANNKELTAGDVGFHYLVKALQEGGASQLIYEMNSRTDVPGYGYQLQKGATALTESWAALEEVSNNHLMLGHIMEWFYSGLGGSSRLVLLQHINTLLLNHNLWVISSIFIRNINPLMDPSFQIGELKMVRGA